MKISELVTELYNPKHNTFVSEAPLTDYVPMGFDKKGTQFNPVDKKLVTHPVNKLKTIKFFEKTPYDFRLFFNDSPRLKKFRETGEMTPEMIRSNFDKEQAEQIINGSENAINIMFVGNYGDQAVMMTPWIMAHRFGHAITATNRRTMGGTQKPKDPWSQFEQYFFGQINDILVNFYNKKLGHDDLYSFNLHWKSAPEYIALFNALGTQRSSREGQIKRPYEFLYELFAQYLKNGYVSLNPLPARLEYGRKAWGRNTKYMGLSKEMSDDELYREQITQELSNNLTKYFNEILKNSVGKIFIM